MFQACKRNNIYYLDKNKDHLPLPMLSKSKDERGNTALYIAVAYKSYDVVNYLL